MESVQQLTVKPKTDVGRREEAGSTSVALQREETGWEVPPVTGEQGDSRW